MNEKQNESRDHDVTPVTEVMCSLRHANMNEKMDANHKLLVELHGKLLVGNGTPSWAVRLDRIEQRAQVSQWVLGVVAGAVILAAVGLGFRMMESQVIADHAKQAPAATQMNFK